MNKLSIKDNILYKYIVYILIFIYYKIIKYNFFSYIKFVNCFLFFYQLKNISVILIIIKFYFSIIFNQKKKKKKLYIVHL